MKRFVVVIIISAVVVAGVVSWFASTRPDGLERVAEDAGFSGKAKAPLFSVLPDYTIPGREGFLSNAAAGIVGVFAVFAFVYLAGRLLSRAGRR